MQVARAGCRARGCGQSGGFCRGGYVPPDAGSFGLGQVPFGSGRRRRRLRILLLLHMSSESRPSVSVSPAVPAVTVDQVPKAACSVSTRSRWMRAPKCARRLTRLSSMTCAERVGRRQRRAHAPQSRRSVSTSSGMSIVNGSRGAVRSAGLADVGAHLACPDPRAYRPPGRRTQQYAGKVRAQSATVAPCGYVWSAKAAVVSRMSPPIGAAGFCVRSGRVSAPSRLRSLTWMDPVSDLPSVLLPFPRLWGLRPAVIRFSARRRAIANQIVSAFRFTAEPACPGPFDLDRVGGLVRRVEPACAGGTDCLRTQPQHAVRLDSRPRDVGRLIRRLREAAGNGDLEGALQVTSGLVRKGKVAT